MAVRLRNVLDSEQLVVPDGVGDAFGGLPEIVEAQSGERAFIVLCPREIANPARCFLVDPACQLGDAVVNGERIAVQRKYFFLRRDLCRPALHQAGRTCFQVGDYRAQIFLVYGNLLPAVVLFIFRVQAGGNLAQGVEGALAHLGGTVGGQQENALFPGIGVKLLQQLQGAQAFQRHAIGAQRLVDESKARSVIAVFRCSKQALPLGQAFGMTGGHLVDLGGCLFLRGAQGVPDFIQVTFRECLRRQDAGDDVLHFFDALPDAADLRLQIILVGGAGRQFDFGRLFFQFGDFLVAAIGLGFFMSGLVAGQAHFFIGLAQAFAEKLFFRFPHLDAVLQRLKMVLLRIQFIAQRIDAQGRIGWLFTQCLDGR